MIINYDKENNLKNLFYLLKPGWLNSRTQMIAKSNVLEFNFIDKFYQMPNVSLVNKEKNNFIKYIYFPLNYIKIIVPVTV